MEFEDLKGRIFKVIEADASAKHAQGDAVTFDGSAGHVKIKCQRYRDGKYENDKISGGTPEMKDTYTITITAIGPTGQFRQITFEPDSQEGSGGSGGSWTANDLPPEPDNG